MSKRELYPSGHPAQKPGTGAGAPGGGRVPADSLRSRSNDWVETAGSQKVHEPRRYSVARLQACPYTHTCVTQTSFALTKKVQCPFWSKREMRPAWLVRDPGDGVRWQPSLLSPAPPAAVSADVKVVLESTQESSPEAMTKGERGRNAGDEKSQKADEPTRLQPCSYMHTCVTLQHFHYFDNDTQRLEALALVCFLANDKISDHFTPENAGADTAFWYGACRAVSLLQSRDWANSDPPIHALSQDLSEMSRRVTTCC